MNIRLAEESDLAELAALYQHTVLQHGPQHYSLVQTQTWASFAENLDLFRHFIFDATTYVATDETGIVGFAGIEINGHIRSTYVRGDRLHQGIGSMLLQALLDDAAAKPVTRLYAEASEFSLGLFQKFGFRLYDTEAVDFNGVAFTRYLVEYLAEGSVER
ncbi:GNAT family N-acetyltransferase [Thermoleptolyngbya sichuanensis XZ-Cy5]|uniref:GNAT family N-acetyltransferase n=1 Tax=Thermoleptolyngbya sichuanensis TaxID=2885951 RepID=UPI00240E561F|nr:GNAT family N-acetyltransferase [Thermoleptolyngbya sichuanensis]MDG2614751.1 GNAT family N-acetyltransferase [Thermoleptolyngbya sichuanensis XZ-Cy5]